jgi:hypothetical protein
VSAAKPEARRVPSSRLDHSLRRLGAAITGVSVALAVGGLLLSFGTLLGPGTPIDPAGIQIEIAVSSVALAFPVLGCLIVRRKPASPLGWVYLAIGGMQALNLFSVGYVPWAYTVSPDGLPASDLLSWVGVVAWMPGFTLLSTAAILLFPDGRLPSRRWWPVLALAGAALLIMIVPQAIATWPYRGRFLALASTGSIAPPAEPMVELAATASAIGQLVLLAATVGSIAGLVVRWRRSRGAQRQQIKWFAFGALILLASIVLSFSIAVPGLVAAIALGLLMGLSLPVTIGIAILRYHLWDIDRIISRTLSYAIVSGLLAAVFAGLVLGLQDVLASVTGASTLAVAASTLAVFALFAPLRRRVQRVVDRRFNRSRYNAEHTVAELTARLRDETDLALVRSEVETAIHQALAPSSTVVWMRSR